MSSPYKTKIPTSRSQLPYDFDDSHRSGTPTRNPSTLLCRTRRAARRCRQRRTERRSKRWASGRRLIVFQTVYFSCGRLIQFLISNTRLSFPGFCFCSSTCRQHLTSVERRMPKPSCRPVSTFDEQPRTMSPKRALYHPHPLASASTTWYSHHHHLQAFRHSPHRKSPPRGN